MRGSSWSSLSSYLDDFWWQISESPSFLQSLKKSETGKIAEHNSKTLSRECVQKDWLFSVQHFVWHQQKCTADGQCFIIIIVVAVISVASSHRWTCHNGKMLPKVNHYIYWIIETTVYRVHIIFSSCIILRICVCVKKNERKTLTRTNDNDNDK